MITHLVVGKGEGEKGEWGEKVTSNTYLGVN
jgi:hypothetical protein